MAFDYKSALAEGYSPAEIADYLSEKQGFNITGAREEGYSDDEILKHLLQSKTAGVVESAKGALKRGLASAETAITAPFVGGEEAGIKGLETQKAIEERPGFSWDEIKRKYEQEGVLPAAGEAISQIPGTIAEQAPTLGAIFTGGRIGAALGSAIPGVGTVAGGIGGAALYPFLTQSGANIERQVQEQQTQGEPVDVSLGKAYGAGLGQTALEMALGPEAFLARTAGKQTAEDIAKKLAAETTLKSAVKGAGKVVAEEVPTEIAQQALERAQAGLPISPTDQQALDEYLASGVGAALAGPVGGPMRLMERSAARDQLAADEQKKQAEEEAQRQAVYEQERQIAEREAIKQEAYDAMLEKVKGTQVGENVDLFNAPTSAEAKAAKARTQEENMRLFGTPTAPQEEIQTPAEEIPSQGGSANLMMQQAMKEAEQQTAIDKANRERAALYGLPEAAPMGEESANRRAQALEESLPFQQRALELQQQQQDAIRSSQEQQASEAMGKKLEQAKPGQTLDLFGKAREAVSPAETVVPEIPSQGGSANLQIQQAMREAEQQTAIDKANRERAALRVSPEGVAMPSDLAENRAKALEEGRALYAEKVAAQEGGQRTIPGIEPMVTPQKAEQPEVAAKTPIEKAVDYLQTLPQEFKSAPKIKEALAKTEFKDLKANQVLQQYKQTPVQTSLFNEPEQSKKFSKTELPNVNSNNQPIAQTPEATKNFWNWFGDSKVADAEGKPLVVYHGTKSDFSTFEKGDLGFHFGTATQAEKILNRKNFVEGTDNIMPVYLSAKNLVRLPDIGFDSPRATVQEFVNAGAISKADAKEINNEMSISFIDTGEKDAMQQTLREELLKRGIDGVIYENSGEADRDSTGRLRDSYIVFDPSQIKSAIGNQGTFNPEEKSIVKSKGVTPTNAHTADTLTQALTKRYGNNAPKVNMGSRADVGGDATVQGFYDPATKSVTLIPENIDQSKDIHGLIRHEIAVHAKQLGKTDPEFQAILKQLQALKDKGSKAVQDAYAKVPKDTAESDIHEEALGYLVEHAKDLPVVRRFMSWLRRMVNKLTGNAGWLRADDFAKMADEVLSAKTKPSTPAREKTAPLYSKANDADLKAATQMYAPPKKAEEPSMQQRVERAKESALGFSVKKAVHDLRTAVAHSGAPIQKHYQEKYNGAMRDALSKEISGHFLFDVAQDSSHLAAASIHQGIPVFENGVPKVKQDPNNVENVMGLMKAFGDRIGSQEDANHAVQAYMLAQNYDRILRNNAKIEKQIEDLKATGKAADKNKAKKLHDFIAKVNAEQVAGIKPGLEYANRHPEIKKIADMWEAIKNADVDFQEKSGTISKELADKYRNDPGYVPMYRVMNEMDAENPGTREYYRGLADVKAEKHFTGSDKDVKNIFDNMTARHMWAVESAIRNYANKRLSEDLGIVGENGETKYYSTQPTGKADTTAPVWINGKRKWVEYADPTFVTALKGVEPIASPLIKALGGASRLLRTSVTAMPTFQLVQILKDAPRAAMLSGVDHPFELMGRVIKDAGVLYADMVSGRDNPILKEMERAGISSGYGHTAEEINDRMRRQLGLEANSKVKQALDMVEKIAAISDAAQRKAVYEQTLKETGDRDLAEDRARNIINWKRHGANHYVRIAAQIVPFMNAYIQSMDVLLSAMTGTGISGKEKAAARRQFASTWGQLMVLSAIYAMVVADDEDYQKMDDKKKLNSLVIPGTGVHIPVASEIGLLVKALPELTYQYVTREGTNNPLDATKLRGAVGNAIGDALLSPNLTPQLLKPAVEVITNHNFLTGTPLIGYHLLRKATSEQFNESTSELAKLLGSTGLISPINVDHLMKGYFGTMGSLGLSTLDSAVNQFSDIKRPADAWYKNPVISPFMNDPRFKDQVNGYYDLLKESDQVTLKLNDLKKSGRFEEAKEYRTEHAEMIRARSQINNLSNRMEKLREQHKKVVDSRMSADEKREKLDALDQRIGSILKNVNSLRVKAGL